MDRKIEFVVDCWVLGTVADELGIKAIQGIAFLCDILESHRLALDLEKRIYNEYSRQIERSRILKEWWSHMSLRSGKLTSKSARLTRAQHTKLVTSLGFDPDDIPYVSTATKTRDRMIVSEDSDYTQTVREYLANSLDIRVLRLDEARMMAKDP